jgi:CheY-like chemotaxis protein
MVPAGDGAEGCDVNIRVARDGEQAILILADEQFDLIILDLNIQKLSGIKVAGKSRPTPIVPDYRVQFELERSRSSLILRTWRKRVCAQARCPAIL